MENDEGLKVEETTRPIVTVSGDRRTKMKGMTRRLTVPRLILLGAMCFWGPELLIYGWTQHETNWTVITYLLPSTLSAAYFLVLFFRGARPENPSAAIYMFVGLWLLGPTAILLGSTFQGAGLYTGADSLLAVPMGLFPPYTCIMTTYDGSLFALLLTLLFPLCHPIFEQKSWIIPPWWRISSRYVGKSDQSGTGR